MEFLNVTKVNPEREQTTIAIKSEIISHAETKFAKIMELDGITCEDIMNSLNI